MASQQLCWTCKKVCGGGGCPWADKLKPVKGGTTEPKEYRVPRPGRVIVSTTYHITACPLYVKG